MSAPKKTLSPLRKTLGARHHLRCLDSPNDFQNTEEN